MKPSVALDQNRQAVIRIVEKHKASNARVFGSVLAGTDHDGSDLDLLVDPTPRMSLFDLGALRAELQSLLGISVDILTPGALPETFRDDVMRAAAPL